MMIEKVLNRIVFAIVVAATSLLAGKVVAADIYWDGGGSNAIWSTAENWSNDQAPAATNDYFVNNAQINSPGLNDSDATVTYTFDGNSLTVTNGGTLMFSKKNPGSLDSVTLNIPNLTLIDSTLKAYSYRNVHWYLNDTLHMEGNCDIIMDTGKYQRWLDFQNGVSGSGNLSVYYPGGGSDRYVSLKSGDFSGYSGDWTVKSDDDESFLFLTCLTSSGWGTGDMTLQRLAKLTFGVSIVATGSVLTVAADAEVDLGAAGTSNTVKELWVAGTQFPHGTWTAAELTAVNASFVNEGTLTVLEGPDGVTLDVASEHGTPSPSVGLHLYVPGTSVTSSVSRVVTNTGEAVVECIGWTGSGSVPASGTSNLVSFTIQTNSTVTWQWQTNAYYLNISTVTGVTTDVSPDYFTTGSVVTITALPTNTLWQGDTDNCTISNNVITCPMTQARNLIAYIPGATVTWDGGGSNAVWTVPENWNNDTAPFSGVHYLVDGAVINDPGLNDDNGNATYTFAGDSLTLTNGGTLYLRKENKSGWDYINEYISNLMLVDSTLQQKSDKAICYHQIHTGVAFRGACTIFFEGGTYGSHLVLKDGYTGGGSLRVYRTDKGGAGLVGPNNANSTELSLDNGDFSGYSGDILLESTKPGERIYLLVKTSSGWGTGDLTVGESGYLYLGASVDASESDVSLTNSATLHIVDNTTSTVRHLTIDGGTVVKAGKYTANDLNALAISTQFVGDSLTNGVIQVLQPTAGWVFSVK